MCTAQINILISDSSINFVRKEKQKKKKNNLSTLVASWVHQDVSGIWVVAFVEVLKLLNCWSVVLPNGEHWVTQCWGRRQFCCMETFLETSQPHFILPGTPSHRLISHLLGSFSQLDKLELSLLRNPPWCPQSHINVPCSLLLWHSTHPYHGPHRGLRANTDLPMCLFHYTMSF